MFVCYSTHKTEETSYQYITICAKRFNPLHSVIHLFLHIGCYITKLQHTFKLSS